MKYKNSQRR